MLELVFARTLLRIKSHPANFLQGSDFDGTDSIASGIDDVSGYPKLIEAVLRRGATDEQVQKLVGENILRVWRQNEIKSAQIRKGKDARPIESFWEGRAKPTFEGSLPNLKAAQTLLR